MNFILVGDSLGMTLYGMKNTRKVTVDMMINHGKTVVKAARNTLVIVDLPFRTYERSPLQAYETACKVIDKTKICKLLFTILDKLSVGIKPPEDIVVNAMLNESRSLTFTKLYKKITKIVEKK